MLWPESEVATWQQRCPTFMGGAGLVFDEARDGGVRAAVEEEEAEAGEEPPDALSRRKR